MEWFHNQIKAVAVSRKPAIKGLRRILYSCCCGEMFFELYIFWPEIHIYKMSILALERLKRGGCLNGTHIEILWCLRLTLLPTIPVHLFQFPQLWTYLKRFEIYDIFHFNDSHKLWLPTKYISFVFIKKKLFIFN